MTNKVSSTGKLGLVHQIEKDLGEADKLCTNWSGNEGTINDERERAQSLIESAFEGSLLLMEVLELPETRGRVQAMYDRAKRDLIETKYSETMGELYLVWSYRLGLIITAAEATCSREGKAATFDKENVGIRQVEQILERFHSIAVAFRTRRSPNVPLLIKDEYDVQYLLEALLLTRFLDIQPEEWTPKYAGHASRMDFLLAEEKIAIEVKMTRDGLDDGEVGDQLIIDIAHYKKHPDCEALVCFVYDPDHRLKRPIALEHDLSGTRDGLPVRVMVKPPR